MRRSLGQRSYHLITIYDPLPVKVPTHFLGISLLIYPTMERVHRKEKGKGKKCQILLPTLSFNCQVRGHRRLSCLVQPGSAATILPGAVAWCELNQGEKYKFRIISSPINHFAILWNQLDWNPPSLVGNWNVFAHFCRQQITTISSTR